MRVEPPASGTFKLDTDEPPGRSTTPGLVGRAVSGNPCPFRTDVFQDVSVFQIIRGEWPWATICCVLQYFHAVEQMRRDPAGEG
jgi:hypothetical protein